MMYMEDKTIKLTVAEFRKQVKTALDYCVEGGVVEINRMGQRFIITSIPRGMDIMFGRSEGAYKLGTDPEKVNHLEPEINIKQEPGLVSTVDTGGLNLKKNRLATPTPEKLQKIAESKGMKFCPNGHAIPEGRSRCMGKGCKYA